VSIGAPELVILGLIGIVPLILGLVVAVDASRLPEAAFERAGTSKTLWIVLPLVGIVTCGVITIVASILWFASYKAKVVRATAGEALPPPLPLR
jgi:cadmium resistance protein CadD (predicted permease)